MSNPCLILEWTDADTWHGMFSGLPANETRSPPAITEPRLIPAERQPRMLQPDRETAETEAKRLAAAHPGKRFAVFEALTVGITVDLPSHITVKGDVFQTRKVAALVEIEGAELPF